MSLEVAVALSDRPRRYPHQLPARIEPLIVGCKRDRSHWGAHKIQERLVRRLDGDIRIPKSAVDAGLHRHGLVKIPGRARRWAAGAPLSIVMALNDLRCARFKGEFKLGEASTVIR